MRGRGARGRQDHAPGMTPSLPCHCCRSPVVRWFERGVGKKHSSADVRGPAGSGCKRRRGDAWAWATCGCHAGPRWQRPQARLTGARATLGRKLGRASRAVGWLQRVGGAGRWLAGPVDGRAGWAEQLAGRPSSLLPFLFFISFSICLNSNLV